jgi:hypothetical protein
LVPASCHLGIVGDAEQDSAAFTGCEGGDGLEYLLLGLGGGGDFLLELDV